MAESSLPPPPPTHGNGLLVGSALVALLLVGGLVFWRVNSQPATSTPLTSTPHVTPQEVTPSGEQAAPPPPPPPPPPEAEGVTQASEQVAADNEHGEAPAAHSDLAKSKLDPRQVTKPDAKNPTAQASNDGCSGSCANRVDAALNQAVRQRGASAKNCYNAALRSNPTLQGKVSVKVRISPTGSTCSANITSDTLGDASVTSCIVQKFKGGGYPKPTGGCADFEVPLSFVPSSN